MSSSPQNIKQNVHDASNMGKMTGPPVVRYRAAAIIDSRGFRGTSLLLDLAAGPLARILAVGADEEVDRHEAAAAAVEVPQHGRVLLPGLVNAHTHLDLTHIGPRPHDPGDGFVSWVHMIRSERRLEAEAVSASIRRGIELSLAGGTVAVGDIAGALPDDPDLTPWRTLADSPLLGVSYQELFAIGNRIEDGRQRLQRLAAGPDPQDDTAHRIRRGVQPHAPFTVDVSVYAEAAQAAAREGSPIATHAAETPEERAFVAQGAGPFRLLLEGLGIWDDALAQQVGRGLHPVEHIEQALAMAPFLVAHVNDAPDRVIEILARTGATVAYCPRASEYFGAAQHFGPHRYREMLAAGVNVALGTDSIVNLPYEAAQSARGGISILDEMRLLHRRDDADPLLLLAMATVNGARALHITESMLRFDAGGELAGVVAVCPAPDEGPHEERVQTGRDAKAILAAILRSEAPPELLCIRNRSCHAGISGRASETESKVLPP